MDFAKLLSFKGRVGRKEYWLSYLAFTVLYVVPAGVFQGSRSLTMGAVVLPVFLLYLWASFAVTTKRLHDTGRSGWWLAKTTLASLVLMVGLVASVFAAFAGSMEKGWSGLVACSLAYLVLGGYCLWVVGLQPGDAAENAYGAPNSGSVVNR